MTACFLSNISAKYYKNPSMLSRVIAKKRRGCFFETQCIVLRYGTPCCQSYRYRFYSGVEFNMLRPTIQYRNVLPWDSRHLALPTEPTAWRPPRHPKSQTISYSPFPDKAYYSSRAAPTVHLWSSYCIAMYSCIAKTLGETESKWTSF